MKNELGNRFSEVVGANHAYSLLSNVQQKPGGTIQVYAERLITLSEEAIPGPGQHGPAIQRQIYIFVDG